MLGWTKCRIFPLGDFSLLSRLCRMDRCRAQCFRLSTDHYRSSWIKNKFVLTPPTHTHTRTHAHTHARTHARTRARAHTPKLKQNCGVECFLFAIAFVLTILRICCMRCCFLKFRNLLILIAVEINQGIG